MADESLNFLARLKQHHIYRVVAGYAVGAWIVIQVTSRVFPYFGWSGAVPILIIILILGFPVVLILAWVFIKPKDPAKSGWQQRHWKLAATASVVVVILVVISGFYVWRFSMHRAELLAVAKSSTVAAAANTPAPPSATAIPAKSVAVLPFVNESDDQNQQYFSDGLSEDLITALSQFGSLKVISRDSSFRFRNSTDSSATIGEKLAVAHLLEGSVQRADQMVRVSATLINASDGTAVWSQHCDRPYKGLFALQDDITQQVATALKAKLLDSGAAAPQSDRPPSGNLAAYNAYLQGEFYRRRENEVDLRKAIAQFTDATRLDPDYAVAYAALASTSAVLGADYLDGAEQQQLYAQSRAASDTALRLDPNLAAAHAARALSMADLLDWNGAQAEYRRALDLAPNDPQTMFRWAIAQAMLGHVQQAVEFARRAELLNPLSASQYRIGSIDLMALGRLDEAEAAINKAIELEPADSLAYVNRTMLNIHRGNATAALAAALKTTPGVWRSIAVTLALQIGTDRAAADAALKDLIGKYANGSSWQIAEVYALRRDPDNMFKWLDRAWANRDGGIEFLLYDPFILRYKSDPRFAAFANKVGLPTTTDAKALS